MRPFIALLTLALASAKPQGVIDTIAEGLGFTAAKSLCEDYQLKPGVCAVLFEEDGCRGTSYELLEGAGNLPEAEQNKHESVVVAPGASFRGYDDTEGDWTERFGNIFTSGNNNNPDKIKNLGKVAILTSFNNSKVFAIIDHLEDGKESDEDLEETIESYSCTFGSTDKCPAVPEHLCAIGYPKPDCSRGIWNSPLEIPVVNEWSLGRFGGGRNALQAVSVRKGCSLTLIDTDVDTIFSDSGRYEFKADEGKDVHVNLLGNLNDDIATLSDDAEHVICKCPGETVPTFSQSKSVNVGK